MTGNDDPCVALALAVLLFLSVLYSSEGLPITSHLAEIEFPEEVEGLTCVTSLRKREALYATLSYIQNRDWVRIMSFRCRERVDHRKQHQCYIPGE
jgi:hypothetical protein